MNNKTNVEEDIKFIEKMVKEYKTFRDLDNPEFEDTEKIYKSLENILADRETLLAAKEIQEYNYQMLSENVSNIAKKLDLEEDATIDEIYIAIRILKSKRANMFEYIDKADKYDSLVEKIREKISSLKLSGGGNGKDEVENLIRECVIDILEEVKGE